jgi:predicted regulator of amino acid metabolism with ACT domain
MADELHDIVTSMVRAGESEEDIALVIQNYDKVKKKEDTESFQPSQEPVQPLGNGSGEIGSSEHKPTERELESAGNQAVREMYGTMIPGASLGMGIWDAAVNVFNSQVPASISIRDARVFRDALNTHLEEFQGLKDLPDDQIIEIPTGEYMTTPTGQTVPSSQTKQITVGERKRELTGKIQQNNKDFVEYLRKAQEQYQKGSDTQLVQDFRQIKGVDDALNFIGAGIGNAIAQMPLALASGGASSFLLESGLTYLEGITEIAREKDMTIEEVMRKNLDDPVVADAMGALSASLDLLGAISVAKKTFFDRKTVGKALKRIFSPSNVEGGTEFLQSIVNQASVSLQQDKPFRLRDIDWIQSLSEGGLGWIGGKFVSLTGGAIKSQQTKQKEDAESIRKDTEPVPEQGTAVEEGKDYRSEDIQQIEEEQAESAEVKPEMQKDEKVVGEPESKVEKIEPKKPKAPKVETLEGVQEGAEEEILKTGKKKEKSYFKRLLEDPKISEFQKQVAKEDLEYDAQSLSKANELADRTVNEAQKELGDKDGLTDLFKQIKKNPKSIPSLAFGSLTAKLNIRMQELGMMDESVALIKWRDEHIRDIGREMVSTREDASPEETVSRAVARIHEAKQQKLSEEFEPGVTYRDKINQLEGKINDLNKRLGTRKPQATSKSIAPRGNE